MSTIHLHRAAVAGEDVIYKVTNYSGRGKCCLYRSIFLLPAHNAGGVVSSCFRMFFTHRSARVVRGVIIVKNSRPVPDDEKW